MQYMHNFLLILVCRDSIPSRCSVPPGITCAYFLNYCEKDASSYPLSLYCGSTPGKVKDYCKATCGYCNGKQYILL